MTTSAYPDACCGDNGEPAGVNATLHEPISADGVPKPAESYTVPARNGRAVRLQRGQVIRIVEGFDQTACPRNQASMSFQASFASAAT